MTHLCHKPVGGGGRDSAVQQSTCRLLGGCEFFPSKARHLSDTAQIVIPFLRRTDSREPTMVDEGLFAALPEQKKPQPQAAPLAAPRLYEPVRDQIEWRAVDIDSLIGEDHPARLIWQYVEPLDLSELDDRIKG